jgi:hypothetical protein
MGMDTQKQTARSFRPMSRVGISPRLILSLTLYVMILLLLVISLLYAPIVTALGIFLVALAVDRIRLINHRGTQSKGIL